MKFVEYTNVSFTFNADISVGTTGFLLQIGRTGDLNSSVSFSGYSGYLFDQSGSMFGGYQRSKKFNISGNYFFGQYNKTDKILNDEEAVCRLSYYLNDTLIANNILTTGFIDAVSFSGQSMNFTLTTDTGASTVLCDEGTNYLLSSDNYYLSF